MWHLNAFIHQRAQPYLMMSVRVRPHRVGKHLKSVNIHMLTVWSRRGNLCMRVCVCVYVCVYVCVCVYCVTGVVLEGFKVPSG